VTGLLNTVVVLRGEPLGVGVLPERVGHGTHVHAPECVVDRALGAWRRTVNKMALPGTVGEVVGVHKWPSYVLLVVRWIRPRMDGLSLVEPSTLEVIPS
jgi:hypothetical protein